jgi:muramoyltetrapeptide carboxypeptidase LdcA involved in peptidoglycan recycling
MLIGRPLHFDEPMFWLDRFGAVLDTVRKLRIPVIMDADIGHLSPMMPLISGSMADITFKDNSLNIEMRLV